MTLSTESSARNAHLASPDELHRLGQIAGRLGPGKGTRKFTADELKIPRESKVAFAIGAVGLLVCIVFVSVRAATNRRDASGTATSAVTAR